MHWPRDPAEGSPADAEEEIQEHHSMKALQLEEPALLFQCDECGQDLSCSEGELRHKFRCPSCSRMNFVPGAELLDGSGRRVSAEEPLDGSLPRLLPRSLFSWLASRSHNLPVRVVRPLRDGAGSSRRGRFLLSDQPASYAGHGEAWTLSARAPEFHVVGEVPTLTVESFAKITGLPAAASKADARNKGRSESVGTDVTEDRVKANGTSRPSRERAVDRNERNGSQSAPSSEKPEAPREPQEPEQEGASEAGDLLEILTAAGFQIECIVREGDHAERDGESQA